VVIQGAFNIGEPRQMKLKDLTGQKFNYLTVLKRVENTKKGQARWECKCKCGKTLIVRSTDLLSGHTRSCGCWRTELNTIHNSSNNRLYHVYMGMKERCYNPKNPSYKNYGERGIKVCNEWQKFKSFNEWALGNGYDKNAQRGDCTIDRIDVNGDYCPENCRWINVEEQCKNKRNNRIYTYNNETLCLKDWADKLKINYPTLQGRLKKGWSFEDAITIPIRKCSRITKAEEE
jgi:hypothetical protein